MKQSLIKDTTIRIGDTGREKMPGKVIEYNVNMSVSLSNAKRSRIYQRFQTLIIIFLTIVFFIVYTQIRREVQVLEAQVNSMNSNIAFLMIKYERLNKNIHRINWQQNLIQKLTPDQSQPNEKLTINNNHNNTDQLKNRLIKNTWTKNDANLKIVNNNLQAQKPEINRTDPAEVVVESDENLTENNRKMTNNLNKRLIRSIVTKNIYDEQNKTEAIWNIMTRKDRKDEEDVVDETRTGRARRDDGRGKGQGGKSKRRPNKCSRRRLGPLVATFVGAEPEQHVTDTVYVGPWVKRNESRYGFNKFHLVENQRSIEVTVNGLFMISVQIVYFGQPTYYSYWILLRSEGTSSTKQVGKCATASANYAAEASCFTSVILPLRRGDRLHIQQQERDRLINLREGHSFIQLTQLSNDQTRKRIFT